MGNEAVALLKVCAHAGAHTCAHTCALGGPPALQCCNWQRERRIRSHRQASPQGGSERARSGARGPWPATANSGPLMARRPSLQLAQHVVSGSPSWLWLALLVVATALGPAAQAAPDGGAVPGELVVVWKPAVGDLNAAASAVQAAASAALTAAAAAAGAGFAGPGASASEVPEPSVEVFTVLEPEAPKPPAEGAVAAAATSSPSSQLSAAGLLRASLVRVAPGAAVAAEAVTALKALLEELPDVAFVQPNYVYKALATEDAAGEGSGCWDLAAQYRYGERRLLDVCRVPCAVRCQSLHQPF